MSDRAVRFPVCERGNVSFVSCPVDAENRARRYLWEQTAFPVDVFKHKVQLLHSMNYVGPVVSSCKTIVTVHDLSYREPAVNMSKSRRIGLNLFSSCSAWRSDAVVTVSEFSKRSVCSSLRLPEKKVRVVPSGPGWNSGRPTAQAIGSVLDKYQIVRPYVTAFAGGYAHKNIPRLLAAFGNACEDLPHRLVLIGGLPENVKIAAPFVRVGFENRVQAIGMVDTDEVYPLLAGSELFVFPSLYEGFGLPLLEAQEAGVAVACSRAAAIPEVAGDGAVYFDPLSIASMSSAIRGLLSDDALRASLVETGFQNARRFSWEAAARAHIEIYTEVAGR